MSRLPDLPLEALTPDQKRVREDILAALSSGTAGGPFSVWQRVPAIAEGVTKLFNAFRRDGQIEERLFEIMVLQLAREWSAQYAWMQHDKRARAAGVAVDVIEAIKQRRRPAFTRDDERLIYDVTDELIRSRTLSEATYRRAEAALGIDRLIELITGIGFYMTVAVTLNVFDVLPPDGSRPLS
jgi:4-carboxymuconolactone decarboxylase